MVGHEAIGPHRDAGLGGTFGEQVAVERIVAVLEEDLLPPIATLRDMVGMWGWSGATMRARRAMREHSVNRGNSKVSP
jgi:hypothetical protein